MSLYHWTYILASCFGMYINWQFMKLFFSTRITSKKAEMASYLLFSIFVGIIYFATHLPLLIVASNFIGYYLLAYFNYEGSWQKRLLSAVTILLLGALAEIFAFLLTGFYQTSILIPSYFESSTGLIIKETILFFLLLLLKRLQYLHRLRKVPWQQYFGMILIPAFSFYLLSLLVMAQGLSSISKILGATALVLLNLTAYLLYDRLIQGLIQEKEQETLRLQNCSYQTQMKIITESFTQDRKLRHDFKHHLLQMQGQLQRGEMAACQEYIESLTGVLTSALSPLILSGHSDVDSILSFKIQKARQKEIAVTYPTILLPELTISSLDLTSLLGNLMDNAIEAAEQCPEKQREIRLDLRETRGQLVFMVENSCLPHRKKKSTRLLTTKEEPLLHGFGLENCRDIVHRYEGSLEICDQGNWFRVLVILLQPE